MKAETIFQICNSIAPLGWILMAVAPRWKWTKKIVLSGLLPLVLGLVYLMLIVVFFGKSEGDFSSLEGVGKLFENPFALTAGWIHYLAFDMFIGAWEINDSQRLGIHHGWVVPCLFFTFMFGPIGLILYFIVRWVKTKKLFHDA
ncbi:MAG: DUF4281 domain-containing protein [Cyclobacteriaceae bacterium]|nr:DUF4281 domain-containing protein [Cyclobacteriaceae bacterium]